MSNPKNVLILSCDAGFGHKSAAQAIAAALEARYGPACATEIANPLDDPRVPSVLRNIQASYDDIVREAPELQRVGYDAIDKLSAARALERAATIVLFRAVHDLLKKRQPDAVVNTYPIYQAPLEAAFVIQKRACPVITVVTDLVTVSRAWFHDMADLCVVPTEIARRMALEAKLPPDSVEVIGIPVHPRVLSETRPAETLRAELGWRRDRLTVLAVGSRRVTRMLEALDVLNHSGFPLQIAAVAGGDDDLHAQLQKCEWHVPAHVYNFVNTMPTLMKASDLLLTKAGGLITTEGLACGLPMLITEFIPGQEVGNVEYVVKHGAGLLAEPPLPLLKALAHWLANDGQALKAAAERARQLGRPRAADDIAQRIWHFAQQGPTPLGRLERLRILFPATAALLDRFNVAWRD